MYKNEFSNRYEFYIPNKEDEKIIRSILIGHSIDKVNKSTLRLDNGIELQFVGNIGCGGIDGSGGGGWYGGAAEIYIKDPDFHKILGLWE